MKTRRVIDSDQQMRDESVREALLPLKEDGRLSQGPSLSATLDQELVRSLALLTLSTPLIKRAARSSESVAHARFCLNLMTSN